MILIRLHELAVRDRLLADPAFETLPVPFVIDLDEGGTFLGVRERRSMTTIPARKKGGEPKTKVEPQTLPIPRAHGNTASQGFARYFVDTVPRVVPMSFDLAKATDADRAVDLAKRGRSRTTFWTQVNQAADETSDPALRAVQEFGRRLAVDPDLAAKVEHAFSERRATPGDRCTFAYVPAGGKTILESPVVRAWYATFYQAFSGDKQGAGPTGFCQVTGRSGPIPTTHPIKLQVPGWMSMGVSLVSYDKAAFESFGLEGTANAAIGYEAADAYGLALKALVQNKLPRGGRSMLRVGETLFLFWTREPASTDFMDSFEDPTPEAVARLLEAPATGKQDNTSADVNDFYCLALASNAARVIVRDYLEESLPKARANVATWFSDLTIASTNKDDHGHPVATFPLWLLAAAMTAPKAGGQPDWPRVNDLVPGLMAAALKNQPLPDSILASCLQRLRAEGSEGFRPARMGLIKLALLRRNLKVTETLDTGNPPAAYVCGRLLEVFEEIQYAALGDVNATVVDKYFGTFSAAPAMVVGRLYANAQNHLQKLRGEKPGSYASLERRLTEVSSQLTAPPKGQLSLIDQGWFALGYYHQKAKRYEEIARRKAEKEEAADVAAEK